VSPNATPWPQVLLERTAKVPSASHLLAEAHRQLLSLAEQHEGFAVDLQWLEQAVAGIPSDGSAAAPVSTLRAYLKDLGDVRDGADHVLRAAKAEAAAPLLAHASPLVQYLEGLYDWCEELLRSFEDIARGLRRGEPIWPVFDHHAVNRSFASFDRLTNLLHEDVRRVRAEHKGAAEPLRALDHRTEELFWAASWLHLSLTRRFGG
jgi:hypothetical protein